jgi:transposase
MSGGIVTEAAKMLRVTARVIYKWIDEDEEIGDKTLRTEMNVNRGMLVDLAETELIKKIKQGDNPSIVFTLRSLGKDRGWIDKVVEKREKKEEGKKEEMKVNVSEMRDEDLEELAEGRVPDGLRILEGGSRK